MLIKIIERLDTLPSLESSLILNWCTVFPGNKLKQNKTELRDLQIWDFSVNTSSLLLFSFFIIQIIILLNISWTWPALYDCKWILRPKPSADWMARKEKRKNLVWSDSKSTVTQITTHYSCGELKRISQHTNPWAWWVTTPSSVMSMNLKYRS